MTNLAQSDDRIPVIVGVGEIVVEHGGVRRPLDLIDISPFRGVGRRGLDRAKSRHRRRPRSLLHGVLHTEGASDLAVGAVPEADADNDTDRDTDIGTNIDTDHPDYDIEAAAAAKSSPAGKCQ